MTRPSRLVGLAAALLLTLAAHPIAAQQLTVTRTYTYSPAHLGVTRVVEATDGTTRATETAYAHEQPSSSGMKDKNMISQVYSVTVRNGSSASADVESKTWTTWTAFSAAGGAWLPSEAWVWRGSGDGTVNDTSAPTTPGDDETFRSAAATAYDVYGRPTASVDARGNSTAFEYGTDNKGPNLTKVTLPAVNGVAHSTAYGYDARYRLQTVTGATGAVTRYDYDGFGRLTGVRLHETPSPNWTTTYAYGYGAAGQPNWVRRRDYASATVYAETISFTDALGRPVQTQEKSSSGYDISSVTYDASGRPYRQYAPYWYTTGGTYDPSVAEHAAFFYNGSNTYYGIAIPNANGRPFIETTYLAEPTGRAATTVGEGNAVAVASVMAYGTAPVNSKTRLYTMATDETGRAVRTYTDGLGRTVASVAGFGAPEAALTQTEFDVLDRATRTTAPEGQMTAYTYDPLGRLVRTVSPDAGTVVAKYDQGGNARFRQDAIEAAAGRVLYTEYDALNRPIETGEGVETWSSLTGWSATPSTLKTAANRLSVTTYGAKPSTSAAPWSYFTTQVGEVSPTFLAGRPSGAVSKSADGAWQAELYSYDRQGRVKKKWVYTTNTAATPSVQTGLNAAYEYAYDWQGRVLSTARTVGNSSFWQWYDYDGEGQLVQVRHATSPARPAAAQVTYSYDIRGSRSSYQYAGGPKVPITYTARGWLAGIGGPGSTTYPFSEGRFYHANGLVSSVEIYNQASPSDYKFMRYNMAASAYDALGRLRSADYSQRLISSNWASTTAYDLTSITYDRNGNLLALRRSKETGGLIDNLTYAYTSGTNRLASVSDAVATTPEAWDAESGSFSYDASGNALSMTPTATTLAYDWRNLPRTATKGGATTTYRYSVSGQRYWSKTGAATAEFVALDGPIVVGRFNETGGQPVWSVLAGGAVVGQAPYNGSARYYHTDALGSVRAVTSGTTVVEARDYDPFGLQMPGRVYVSGTPTRQGFTGHELDAETGMNYAGARYYMPALGRWTSVDPLADQFASYSPYNYALNNPLSLTDPTGMAPSSTHTDKDGNVLAVYNDGDTGVYRHEDVASVDDLDKKCKGQGVSCGGNMMGRTREWDEFATHEGVGGILAQADEKTNRYNSITARIDFGEHWMPRLTPLHEQAHGKSAEWIGLRSGGGGQFDVKTLPGLRGRGMLLGGYYVSDRSAGNFLAGMNAHHSSGIASLGQMSFGTFQRIAGGLHREGARGAARAALGRQYGPAPYYGEIEFQYRWSRRGWNYPIPSGL